MKPKIVLLALICVIVFNNCSKNSDPVSPNPNNLTGVILLKIDRENAPASVTLIEATLSRTGYDSVFAFLNLMSDSTAEVTLDNIPAGVWHLQVDAKDSVGEVLYTGQTDVEILAGFVVQVHLTLYPTGLGTGGIYIFVTWGSQAAFDWTDSPHNPVLIPFGNYYDSYGISQPAVIKDGNTFKMWYVADAGGAVKYVFYAESNDGVTWNRPSNQPALSPGPYGSWDSKAVHPGAVIKDGGSYKMYYCGWSDQNDDWHVGLATSTDGIVWTKHPFPVLIGGTSNEEKQVVASSVIKINNTFYMYYSAGFYLQSWKIHLATSTDGINWVRSTNNPILAPSETWEGSGIYHGSVIMDGNNYKMVYMNRASTGFGVATSPNGINWSKSNNNPFFSRVLTHNNWGSESISYPNWIKLEYEQRIYYTGKKNYSSSRIGFMKKPGN